MLTSVGNKLKTVVGLEFGKRCVNHHIPFGISHRFPEVFRDVGSGATSRLIK
jgi:hypothetical protein